MYDWQNGFVSSGPLSANYYLSNSPQPVPQFAPYQVPQPISQQGMLHQWLRHPQFDVPNERYPSNVQANKIEYTDSGYASALNPDYSSNIQAMVDEAEFTGPDATSITGDYMRTIYSVETAAMHDSFNDYINNPKSPMSDTNILIQANGMAFTDSEQTSVSKHEYPSNAQANEIAYTDSGYASALNLDYSSNVQAIVDKAEVTTSSDATDTAGDDTQTIYSAATTVMPEIAR
jgi:hypothetical protein